MHALRRVGVLVIAGVVCAGVACSGGSGDGSAADSLTRRERDSLIGESGLPGAQGVWGALRAADSAAARNARADSIGND